MTDLVSTINQLMDITIVRTITGMVVLLFCAAISFVLARKVGLKMIRGAAARTRSAWDDALVRRGVFSQVTFLVPAVVLYFGISFFSFSTDILGRVILSYVVINLVIMINRLLSAGVDIYETYPVSVTRPIKGYVQLLNMVVHVLGGVSAICVLLAISPWGVLSGLGAVTALLILVFRDTILSLIASVQIAAYDLVRRGDWIEMPQLGVDGDVIDVALHTIRVQNWDKTIITVPTHRLVQDSFKNWRGMAESGGRRIKRSVLIDQGSIKFLNDKDVEAFSRIDHLKSYLTDKTTELRDSAPVSDTQSHLLNGRTLTNIGTFRAYVEAYLRENSKIHKKMTFLVRQLPPSSNGLPLEIYVFTNDTDWGRYESIQADIFDHLLAALSIFELRVFQHPTGFDMKNIMGITEIGVDTNGS